MIFFTKKKIARIERIYQNSGSLDSNMRRKSSDIYKKSGFFKSFQFWKEWKPKDSEKSCFFLWWFHTAFWSNFVFEFHCLWLHSWQIYPQSFYKNSTENECFFLFCFSKELRNCAADLFTRFMYLFNRFLRLRHTSLRGKKPALTSKNIKRSVKV